MAPPRVPKEPEPVAIGVGSTGGVGAAVGVDSFEGVVTAGALTVG